MSNIEGVEPERQTKDKPKTNPLESIAKDVKVIKYWIIFFGIITLLSIIMYAVLIEKVL
ncbi:hypothetical protein ULMS_00990 [Patiriisocius marinistellae]|uniref:Uncharacterized protein n=1 Tax=Patiriisocius marinistellae TaxID=2494560 RepID=A0A5J4FY30_9FLAO|nr:hypothetical protein [Patiriisocius marinistellae]GEQ84591.1 hypothetical protein ULMS_00990 [Patiriisocius marinistellae]